MYNPKDVLDGVVALLAVLALVAILAMYWVTFT